MALTMARAQDGIPIVQSTTDRGTRFPSPADDQRVFNKGTHSLERYSVSSGGWVTDSAFMPPSSMVGDGVNDDTAGFNADALAALGTSGVAGILVLPPKSYKLNGAVTVPAGVVVDATGSVFTIAASVSFGLGAEWHGGTIQWTTTGAIDAFVPTADKTKFRDVEFIGSGAIGTAGSALYQRAINGTKYNSGTVERCRFSNMTVGVWVGGSSLDPTPYGWRITDNDFTNIVGYRGQSEGYAVLFTPASSGWITHNRFNTIARHPIYLAGGACRNLVAWNNIDTADNVGIQLNTFLSQPVQDHNTIAFNEITNITKSIAYGYNSAVGIGIYGNNTNTMVVGNRISKFVDIGIQWSSPSTDHTSSVVGFGAFITKNWIDGNTGVACSDSCIRTDDPDDCVVTDNDLIVANNTYGIVTSGALTLAVSVSYYQRNRIRTMGSGSTGVRIQSTNGAHTFGPNDITGPGTAYDTTSGGGGFAVLPVDGYLGLGDNDWTYTQGVTPRTLNQTTTLTANRVLTLGTIGAGAGSVVRVARPSSGAFTYTVKDGSGTTIKALSTGQWVECLFNGSAWQSIGSGSL